MNKSHRGRKKNDMQRKRISIIVKSKHREGVYIDGIRMPDPLPTELREFGLFGTRYYYIYPDGRKIRQL